MTPPRDDCWATHCTDADGIDRGPCSEGDAEIVDSFGDMWSVEEELVTACPAHVERYRTEKPYSPGRRADVS